MCRFEFDESAADAVLGTVGIPGAPVARHGGSAPAPAPADPSGGSRNDLAMVEDLLDRCWREVDASSLNVKLADLVRLLEFKNKLRSAADADHTFWTMIDEMRREELDRFAVVEPVRHASDPRETDESEIAPAPE